MSVIRIERHRRVLIMGLGLFGGGLGAARFWRSLGAEVTVTDLRTAETLASSVQALEGSGCRLVLGGHREEDFRQCDLVVVNPAVRPDDSLLGLARAAGARIVTEVGLVLRIATGPVLAVTGSAGKSTTTSLLGAMLRAHDPHTLVGGNLGGSLLPALAEHPPSSPIILELSSFQLHYLQAERFAPAVAVVTGLSPNHLDWHGTMLRYCEAKRNLLRFQTPEQYFVLTAADPILRGWAEEAQAKSIFVDEQDPETENACFVRKGAAVKAADGKIVIRLEGEETELSPVAALRLPGRHNLQNALEAAAAAFVFARNPSAVNQGLSGFRGLPHRLELVAEGGGIRYFNDSKSTTPEAAALALEAFEEPKVLILGGSDKGASFEALGEAAVRRAAGVVLIGAMGPKIGEAIDRVVRAAGTGPRVIDAGTDFPAAVRAARSLCPSGGVVILSPACASFDMFSNYEERGERFRRIAEELAAAPNTGGTP